MAKDKEKSFKPKARLPRGLRDQFAADVLARTQMLRTISAVYELYGFEALETSALEYADALGKFLPDIERPMGGVFSLQDDDEQWLALRYDLTAPLARLVAEHFDELPKPFRRYQMGPVWRNEKPGPGRFREFYQIDADTVGSGSMAVEAELCAMLCDSLEALGIARGDYVVRVNNRKLLMGFLDGIGITGESEGQSWRRLIILRAVDKLERLGEAGVAALLGAGRKDESGDFTKGAELSSHQIRAVMEFLAHARMGRKALQNILGRHLDNAEGRAGLFELETIDSLLTAAGFGEDRVVFDTSVVRGLDYYTGPVLEAELTFNTLNEAGETVRFGSVAGGGRYDGLIGRFKAVEIPAAGVSIGVDRLLVALKMRGPKKDGTLIAPVVVLVLDQDRLADYQVMTFELRRAGIRTELYLGAGGMRAQLKYADKRNAPVAVIQGEDECAAGQVTLKDLRLGAAMSAAIEDNVTWREGQPAQELVARAELVPAVRAMLARSSQRDRR
jgi:histidyl-tRNA synthetase